jgi:hypothetical protein
MESVSSLFEKKRSSELILSGLFIIYLIMGFKMPAPVANMVDTIFGKVAIILSSLGLFVYGNPVLGVLGLMVAYKLISTSSITTGTGPMERFQPTEARKWQKFTPIHQFPYTLEQEVVSKMAPIASKGLLSARATYRPTLEDLHDAQSVHA